MVQTLDALELLFCARQNRPFIALIAVDPHIIITAINHNMHSALSGTELSGHHYLKVRGEMKRGGIFVAEHYLDAVLLAQRWIPSIASKSNSTSREHRIMEAACKCHSTQQFTL